MHGNRRLLTFYTPEVISRFVYFCAYITVSSSSLERRVPIEIKLWDTGRTPLAHMVDVTNEFGLKVLAEHNFLNDNNIAFSPYGLMGIMVALYEGVDGECSYQMQRGMQLPRNRNIMRVGFRDIHRTLKTYFVPEEGFLAGLSLNNENVTFNEQYKKTLRFYGFDLENDQLPTISPDKNNTSNVENSAASTVTPAGSGVSSTISIQAPNTPGKDSSTTSNREDTTTTINPNAETISTIDIRGPTSTITIPPSVLNSESTTLINAVPALETATSEMFTETLPLVISQADISADQPTITSIQITTMQVLEQPATVSTPISAISTDSTTQSTMNEVSEQSTTTSQSTAMQTETATLTSNSLTNEPTTNNDMDTNPADNGMSSSQTIALDGLTTATSMQTTTETMPKTQLTTDSSTIISSVITESTMTNDVTASSGTQQIDEMSTMTTTDMGTTTNSVTANVSTLEILERRRRSIVDFIFTNPPYVDDYLNYRSYDVDPEITKSNFDDEMFLANGLKNVQVTYMRYETVLEYAYLPHLEAAALRLPLDSDRYYLLVVLPKRRGPTELRRLISRMARESDLSDIYSVLRPRRVRGTVPSFIVKGHITLTTDLQKMGIRDVFEPRQRDFTPMTTQAGVYVRSIEQAVSVAIRKYQQHDQKKHRYVTNRDPVLFPATYPFVYFVMDSNIHVALMAGKMVDPLNSRIL